MSKPRKSRIQMAFTKTMDYRFGYNPSYAASLRTMLRETVWFAPLSLAFYVLVPLLLAGLAALVACVGVAFFLITRVAIVTAGVTGFLVRKT